MLIRRDLVLAIGIPLALLLLAVLALEHRKDQLSAPTSTGSAGPPSTLWSGAPSGPTVGCNVEIGQLVLHGRGVIDGGGQNHTETD